MTQKKPLLNSKNAFFLYIFVICCWFIPDVSYYILFIVQLPMLFLIFLDAYAPAEENRNPFIWKLRTRVWGEPK